MPNRVLRDVTDSDKVNTLSAQAEVMFYRLMMKADDYGAFHAKPSLIKAALFPLRLDKTREADISRWMEELLKAGLIAFYESESKPYLVIINFGQRLRNMKKRFPAPPDNVLQLAASGSELPPETKLNQKQETESETKSAHARDRVGYFYEDFIVDFNLLTKRSYVGDAKSKGYFNARVKEGFKQEQFKRAISNCMADRYHVETNLQHLTPEFILRQDKLQKFLNSAAGTSSPSVAASSENPYWNYCPNTWNADFYNRIKSENYADRKVAAYEQKLKKNGYRKVGDGWEKVA